MKKKHLFKLFTTTAAAAMFTAAAFGQNSAYDNMILGDHPVSYWPMQETVGPTIHDVAGTNNGTLQSATDGPNFANSDVHSAFTNDSGVSFGMGGPGVLFGETGDKAIYFTNVLGDQLVVPYSSNLDGATFSAEAWINIPTFPLATPPATVDEIPLGFEYNGGSGQSGWLFDMQDGNSGVPAGEVDGWSAHANGGGWNNVYGPGSQFNGEWVHVVLTYDGTNLVLYENGNVVSAASAGYRNNSASKPSLVMGSYFTTDGAYRNRFFEGGLAHVAVYGYALSSAQILSHYTLATEGPAAPPPGTAAYDTTVMEDHPVSYWPMQETNGVIVHDVVGTNNGTMQVATDAPNFANSDVHSAFTNDNSGFDVGGPGVLFGVTNDTAIYFTNVPGDQIVVPYSAALDASNFTAEAWVKIPTFPLATIPATVDEIPLGFEYNGGNGQSGWLFDLEDGKSGTPAGELDGWSAHANGGGWNNVYGPGNEFNGQWVHAALTYDGSNFTLYENGVSVSHASGAGYRNNAANKPSLVMGSYFTTDGAYRNRFFEGGLSHVAVYPYALSAAQVLNHYTIGTIGATAPIIGTQPTGITNYVGYSRSLTIVAAGSSPLFYQWYNGSSPVTGGTNASLILNNLKLSDAGTYSVTITNAVGSTNSEAVTVQVLALPSNPYQSAIITQFPRAYYPLNETSGTVANDLIQTGNNHATYVNSPILGDQGASSYLGTSVTVDGATQGIVVNDPNAMGITGKTTMEAWVLLQATNFEQYIIDHGPFEDGNPSEADTILGITVDTNSGNGLYYIQSYVETENRTSGAYYPIPPQDIGQWVHLVGTADGSAWNLYRDGVLVASTPDTEGAASANGGWAFAARNATYENPPSVIAPFFWGSLQDIAIYDYALSPQMVSQHYQIGLTGTFVSPPTLSVTRNGASLNVSWTAGYLQSATSLTGPWSYVNSATSPYTASTLGKSMFFRATLTAPH